MLEIQLLRTKPEEVVARLKVKNFDASGIVERILQVDAERRLIQKSLDDTLAESNQLARDIGALYKAGNINEADGMKERTAGLKNKAKLLQEQLDALAQGFDQMLVQLPNLPHASVRAGKAAEDNEMVHSEGDIPPLAADAMPHWDLARKYDLIDFECGTRITGAGFPVYKGKGARLQRALIGFFLDNAVEAGYTEYQPPLLVNEASAYATGQLPDKDGQMYHVGLDNLYLIPTAEVPVTNFFRDMIIKASELPMKSTAYSACFRREAGSYGKDVRGLNRLHQFDKVEIVQIARPSDSYTALDEMVQHVTGLLRKLELPFRVMRLCGGDMSFASALTYDMEVFSAAQQRWLEVSSVSNFETFQSNRMKLRFRDDDGKIMLAHTLNGSALALPRIVAALLENNQSNKGIKIPKALQPYTGFEAIV
ncbi:MAG TPA: serine--tRNA ligase [Bacteroidales bacterium]|nr:serine--tRNA ligase [Bacteroidales bacterium]